MKMMTPLTRALCGTSFRLKHRRYWGAKILNSMIHADLSSCKELPKKYTKYQTKMHKNVQICYKHSNKEKYVKTIYRNDDEVMWRPAWNCSQHNVTKSYLTHSEGLYRTEGQHEKCIHGNSLNKFTY